MTTKEASKKWKISERRVRVLCKQGKLVGAYHIGRAWYIPDNCEKPEDGRYKTKESLYKKIDEKLNLLKSKRPLTEGELLRLNEEFIKEYTYNSNAIEGNTLTLKETDLVLQGFTIDKKPLKDHLEAIGHKEAFDFVCDLVKERKPLFEKTIKDIHFLVLADKKNDRGIYRKIPVRIIGAKHDPVQPYLIQSKMEELLVNYQNSNEHIITKLAKLHLEFEGIHPFIDGNGRTGRLIINFELMKEGFPPIDIKFNDRMEYYKAFDKYFTNNDSTFMEKLFAKYLNLQLDFYLNILNE